MFIDTVLNITTFHSRLNSHYLQQKFICNISYRIKKNDLFCNYLFQKSIFPNSAIEFPVIEKERKRKRLVEVTNTFVLGRAIQSLFLLPVGSPSA